MAYPISIQLYTVRQASAADFPGTLKEIADIGYQGVEFAGLHDLTAPEVKAIIDDLGLVGSSAHTPLPTPDNINELVDTWQTLGVSRLISGAGPDDLKTADDARQLADLYQQAARLLAQHGMTFGYHNHWWEFDLVDGRTLYDLLFEVCGREVFHELDVYWVAEGKQDPVEATKKYADNTPLYHIKDGNLQGGPPHTAVGAGKLDIAGIINAANPDVTEWLVVELDDCATDMMEAVRQSYTWLTSNGLAKGNR